jgi:tape measure domain-containing protein
VHKYKKYSNMSEVNKLMFEIGIKDIRKSLDAYKKDLEKWVKDNPVKLRVEIEGLQDKLRSMGVVFGESNKQIQSMAKETEKMLGQVDQRMRSMGKGSDSIRASSIDKIHTILKEVDSAISKIERHPLFGDNPFSQKIGSSGMVKWLKEYRQALLDAEKNPIIGSRGGLASIMFGDEQLIGKMNQVKASAKSVNDLIKSMDMLYQVRQRFDKIGDSKPIPMVSSDKIKENADRMRSNLEYMMQAVRQMQELRSKVVTKGIDDTPYGWLVNDYKRLFSEFERMSKDSNLWKDSEKVEALSRQWMGYAETLRSVASTYAQLYNVQTRSMSQKAGSGSSASVIIDPKSVQEAVYQVSQLENRITRLHEMEQKASGLGIDTTKMKNLIQEMEGYLSKYRQIIDNGGRIGGGKVSAFDLKAEGDYRSFTARISENTRELSRNISEKQRAAGAESQYSHAVSSATSELSRQSQVMQDLRTMAQQYISLWAAKSFLDNIIEQGGQLEQQRLSIQAILGDAAQANALFTRVKGLAIQSPFGVTEIDQMTKQLSAYGFEYHELFDMTKRLADISAATGTEVSRLALALGHVRSEGALSGYTLRQFSMGNIPLLAKLSEKLGVTTKEIRKMVSKKEIGYDQVVEVLQELTDKSGMFYNAQETMSEALNAKFKNLRDSFQIMYSEMAESSVGDGLKDLAVMLTELSQNWRILLPLGATAVGLYGLQKAATLALNHELAAQERYLGRNAIATSKYSMAQLRAIATTGRFSLALRGLWRGLASLGRFVFSPATMGFAAIEGLVYLWQRHNQEMERAKELTKTYALESSEALRNLKTRMDNIDPFNAEMTESQLKQGIDAMTETLKNYAVNAGEVMASAFAADENGKVKSLAEQYQYLREKMEETLGTYREMEKTADSFEFGVKYSDGGWFDDSVETDLTQYANAVKDYEDSITEFTANNQIAVKRALDAVKEMEPVFAAVSGELKSDAERVKWLLENQGNWSNLFENFKRQLRFNGADYGGVIGYNTLHNVETQRKEAMDELDKFFVGVEERMKKFGYDFGNNGKELTKEQVGNLLKQTREWIEKHPEWNNIIDVISEKFEKRWGIKIGVETVEAKKELNEWQQQMQDWLDKHNSTIKIKPEMSRDDIIKLVHNSIKDTQEVIDQTKPILLRFGVDLSNIPDDLPLGLRTPWGKKQAADYKSAAPQNKVARDFLTEFGLPAAKEKRSGSKSAEDKKLKEARTRLEEVKSFLNEYKKYRDTYGKERAINILEDLFPSTKGRGKEIVDNFKGTLNEIKNSLKLNTEDRKKFGISIDKLIADTDLDSAKEIIDRKINAIERYISDVTDKISLYRTLLNDTGSKEFAMSAFVDGMLWNDEARILADTLREKMGEKGNIVDWEADKQTAQDWFKANFNNGEELFKLWEKISDMVRGNYQKSLEESANVIKANLTYEERIAAIREKYEQMRKEATTDRARYATNKAEQSEIAQVKLDELKENVNWEVVFGNLKTYTKKVLVDVRKNLSEYIRLNRSKMDVKALKEVESAMSELDRAIADKSGLFSGLAENIEAYKKATEELTEAEKEYQEAVSKYGKTSAQAQDAKQRVNQAKNNVVQAQGNVSNSQINTMQKIAKISQALVSLGKSNEATLSDVGNVIGTVVSALSETGEGIGALIAAIFALLDGIGEMGIDKFLGNILDGVAHAVGGIIAGVGNIFGGIFGQGDAFDFIKDDLFGDGYHYYNKAKAQYDQLVQVWDSLIEKKKEYLNQKWGVEAQQAGAEALAIMRAEMEASTILAWKRLSAGASMGSHSIGYRMWQGSYDYRGTNWRDVAGEISRSLGGVQFNSMEDMLEMTGEQLLWIKENYVGLWANMDGDFREHLENVIAYGDKEAEIIDKMKEKMTGWKLDTVKNEWADLMATMSNSSDKLAENLEDKLRHAILNSMVDSLFSKKLQALIDSASVNDEYIDSNGNVRRHTYDSQGNVIDKDIASEFTKAEWDMLMDMAKANSAEAMSVRDMLKNLYGWSDSDGGTSSTAKGIQGVTEQTADILAGYVNSIRADVSVIRSLKEGLNNYHNDMYRVMTQGCDTLRNIEESTNAIMRSNEAMMKSNQEILNLFNGLKTKAWKLPIS